MNFSFEPTNIIRSVNRTVKKVVLAGVVVLMAASATPVTASLNGFSLSDPLEKKIALCVSPQSISASDIIQLSGLERRIDNLQNSLKVVGTESLPLDAKALWDKMVIPAANIPFESVFSQFDSDSESFFFAFSFKSGQRLEATIYVDEEDDDVYFSVTEKGKVIFQNTLQRENFFRNANSTWRRFSENV